MKSPWLIGVLALGFGVLIGRTSQAPSPADDGTAAQAANGRVRSSRASRDGASPPVGAFASLSSEIRQAPAARMPALMKRALTQPDPVERVERIVEGLRAMNASNWQEMFDPLVATKPELAARRRRRSGEVHPPPRPPGPAVRAFDGQAVTTFAAPSFEQPTDIHRIMKIITSFLCLTLAAQAADDALTKAQSETTIQSALGSMREKAATGTLPTTRPKALDPGPAEEGKRKLEIDVRELDLGEHHMPYAVLVKGAADKALPLFICMHGGGQNAEQTGPHTWEVNTREFQTQVQFAAGLYKPDGIYFVPRMADDRLGRWWHKHNQNAFDQVIDTAILRWNADPNRVYLMGVSEGGYGTDILAPFMADRWAGADAMAAGVGLGNPPANLRNVAFRTDIGEKDTMFDRRPMAEAFHKELDRLHAADTGGYVHSINIQPGRGHGIDYRQGIQWIVEHVRNPWPDKIVWINQPMDGLRRERFYWLEMPGAPEKGDIRVDASADRATNTLKLEVATLVGDNSDGNRTHGKDNVAEAPRTPLSGAKVNVLLSDALVNLDQPVTVVCNGKQVFSAKISRSSAVISEELAKRPDPAACPTARLEITTP